MTPETVTTLTWVGIAFCITQSAIFSGLNLAMFSIPRLSLEIEAQHGSRAARKILHMRKDSNFLLATILWGNVGINVLLTLLSDSVLAGVSAFIFSTVAITFMGEIFPQAYFSRNAIKMASLLSPILKMYQFILYPVAKPVGLMLDAWLGKESNLYYRERELREMLRKHVEADDADEIERLEGIGAANFLSIDDVGTVHEGANINPDSILELPEHASLPVFPKFEQTWDDPMMQQIDRSGEKWVILTGPEGNPLRVLDADGFLRAALFSRTPISPYKFCHRPIVVRDPMKPLGDIIIKLKRASNTYEDEVIDKDIVLLWTEDTKKIITGADLLGRLFKGITPRHD
jgi:hypothetical protein